MAKYAAVDIGSNSVRMEVAEVDSPAEMRILASERQVTRLGESVFRNGRVSTEAMDLTCAVLDRMAKIYQKHDISGIRAVATSAIRDARNQHLFMQRAAAAIGAPVETISGAEESRLIHLGVQWRWPQDNRRVLILDIGGGSAEIILSDGGTLTTAFSKPLGAVRLKELFLKNDPPTEAELHRMNQYIAEKVSPAVNRIGGLKIDRLIGTSATAAAVVSAINRVSRDARDRADRLRATSAQIRKLYAELSVRDCQGRQQFPGIGPKRAEIIVPGLAVLRRVVQDFRQPSFVFSIAGVRDGIIADLFSRGVGKELSMLDREQRRVVEQAARRYGVSLDHARKVAEIAHSLFTALESVHKLPRNCGKLLQAAALLMDTGHYVSDTRHHRHSHYLVAHAALPGFTDNERQVIANLCRYHRKSMPTALHPGFQALGEDEKKWVVMLTPLLRLADALDRSRRQPVRGVSVKVRGGSIDVTLDSHGDTDLEVWAAEAASTATREVYGLRVAVQK